MCVVMMMMMMHLHLLLCGFLCSALPPPAFATRGQNHENSWNYLPDVDNLKLVYDFTRSTRHADGLFTSGYSRLLSQLTAKDYLESLITKRVNDELPENHFSAKRHSDAIFTNNYSRFRKQMAAKKYLNSMLHGKRSVEDSAISEAFEAPDSTSSQSAEDSLLYDIINQLIRAP